MENSMRFLPVFLLVGIVVTSADAQDVKRPERLSGFLKPEMCLGIRVIDETEGIRVTVYTKEAFEIAKDSKDLAFDELVQKHEAMRRLRDQRLKEVNATLEAKREDLRSDMDFGEPKFGLPVDRRELFCRVEHVGNDYILVQYADEPDRRRVFATSFISSIRWKDSDDLGLSYSVGYVAKEATKAE
ncbi:hypothetical protein RBSWK_05522 [Rhodopirellula baltica SWK14]|uniref:Uncharacterized protein n=2 Tax=Rhodopirellula baltica TaxID=265606 RepID=L7C9T8_RHOBT|nr:hypothetical protein RBSWK_05522 [Rhodopirellula baltica SWK14]